MPSLIFVAAADWVGLDGQNKKSPANKSELALVINDVNKEVKGTEDTEKALILSCMLTPKHKQKRIGKKLGEIKWKKTKTKGKQSQMLKAL